MHDGENFDCLSFCSIDHAVGEAREPTLVDVAFDLRIHFGSTENSVERIFQEIKKSLIEARLSFRVKRCRLVSF